MFKTIFSLFVVMMVSIPLWNGVEARDFSLGNVDTTDYNHMYDHLIVDGGVGVGSLVNWDKAKPLVVNDFIVNVKVNGNYVYFNDAVPYLDKTANRTMIPIRFVAEDLGATVKWDNIKREVTLIKGDKTIKLIIGQNQATVNGQVVTFDAKAVIKDDRTFVPLRFISETFGAKVSWEAVTNTAIIETN